jgi:outer membrane receptor for ferrienterochelin and colicins
MAHRPSGGPTIRATGPRAASAPRGLGARQRGALLLLVLGLPPLGGASAQAVPAGAVATAGGDLFDLSPAQLAAIPVVSASLAPQRLADSSASVTVVTAAQIREMGARTLYDVLRAVPGLRVDVTNRGRPVVAIRGVRRDSSNQLLFLLDGHRLNEPANGSATFLFELSYLPLENVARVEVIRGPASTVFGSNAFLGVVSVITWDGAQVRGLETTLRTEFDQTGHLGNEVNLLAGGAPQPDRSWNLNLNLVDRDGERTAINGNLLGPAGTPNQSFEQLDLQARGTLGAWTLLTRYTHQDRGEYIGALYQLNPDDRALSDSGFIEVRGEFAPGQFTRLQTRAYADYLAGQAWITNRRAGTIPPNSAARAFNETGITGWVGMNTGKAGLEARATDTRFSGHEITYGVLWEYQAQTDLRTYSNDIGLGRPVYPPRNTSDLNNFGQDASRTLAAPYIEDIWQARQDLIVTAGLRLDHYSDFGDSLNPRVGVTWRLDPRYALRALYGTAFRAPDFRSLFLESPIIQGNPNLAEEQVRTVELGLTANPIDPLTASLTLFRNHLDQLIMVPPGAIRFQNAGSMTSTGVEVQARYGFANEAYLQATYTYVNARLEDGNPAPDEPRNIGSLQAWVPVSARLGAGLTLYSQDASPRAFADRRPDLPGYGLLNLNLLYRVSPAVRLGLAVYNLLDADYAMPSPLGTVLGDFPGAGRSFRAELRIDLR